MFTFLRKIRKSLIDSGSARKYALYAIGEILLVMIGILLALQVSNWNDNRKKQQREIVQLIEIKNSLTNDLEKEIKGSVDFIETAIKTYDSIGMYNTDAEIKLGQKNGFLVTWLHDWRYQLNTAAFENLKSIGADIISSDTLRSAITSMYVYNYANILSISNLSRKFIDEQVRPVLDDNIDQFKGSLSESDLDLIENFTPIKNRLSRLYLFRFFLLNNLNDLLPKIENLISDIDNEINRLGGG